MTKHFVTFFPKAILLLALSGCNSAPEPYTATGQAFSRPLEVTVQGVAQPRANEAAQSAIEDLLFIAEVSHPWKPGPLGRTNQLFTFESRFSANPSILPMIRKAAALAEKTGGYYAPHLGKLQQLWGFHSEFPEASTPDREEIEAILDSHPQMSDIQIHGIRMQSTNAELRIDFGAFAQGYALDTARQRLQEQGIHHARIANGNAVVALGDGWTYTLPTQPEQTLPLHDGEAAVTLTTEGHAFDSNDAHPYLDPATGYPSKGLRSVTVIHSSAADAAAIAQALLAGGEEKLNEQLAVIPVEFALITTIEGKSVTTPGLDSRIVDVRNR
ncbi:MAG: FAD:protein FMN transferase [Pseudomonadota bacterium]